MKIWTTISERWHKTMPKFFAVICWVGALISGTALAVNEAMQIGGAVAPDWWVEIYPYLVGMPAAAAFVAKFTRTYDDENKKVVKKVVKKNENDNDN